MEARPSPAGGSLRFEPLVDLLRRLTRSSAWLSVTVAVAMSLSTRKGALAGAAVTLALFVGLQHVIIQRFTRRAETLWARFRQSSSKDQRYSCLQTRQRELSGSGDVDLVISRSASLNAATHLRGSTMLVELPLGFLRSRWPLQGARASRSMPPNVDAMLAHEASHASSRDPAIYVPLLAEVIAAIAASIWAVVFGSTFGWLSSGIVGSLTAVAGIVLVAFGWTACVRGRELVADFNAAQQVGIAEMRAALEAQTSRAGERDRVSWRDLVREMRDAVVRYFAHPELQWRAGLPALQENLGWRALVIIGAVLAASLAVQNLATAVPAQTFGGHWLVMRIAQLSLWVWTYWVLFQIFWFKDATRQGPSVASAARSLGRALIVGTSAALVSTAMTPALGVLEHTAREGPFLRVGLVLGAWASANVALAMKSTDKSPHLLAGMAFLAATAVATTICVVGVAAAFWWLAESAPAALRSILGDGTASFFFPVLVSVAVTSATAIGVSMHVFAHARLRGQTDGLQPC